jgi:hypothetical protein
MDECVCRSRIHQGPECGTSNDEQELHHASEHRAFACTITLHVISVGHADQKIGLVRDLHAQALDHDIMDECVCRSRIHQGLECGIGNGEQELHRASPR